MIKTFLVVAGIVCLANNPVDAAAITTAVCGSGGSCMPTVQLLVNGVSVNLTNAITVTTIDPLDYMVQVNITVPGLYTVSGFFTTSVDPQISYSMGFTNLNPTASTMFSMLFSTPYIGGPYTTATSTQSGTYTDTNNNGSVIVNPGSASAIHTPNYDGTTFGQIVGGCSVTVSAGSSGPCGSGNLSGIAVSTAAAGTLSLTLSPNISAGDSYSATGLARLGSAASPTPEPGTLSTIAGGLILVAALRRKRAHTSTN
jgi:hypothetical protein